MKTLLIFILLFAGCSLATQPAQPVIWVNATDTLTIYTNSARLDSLNSASFATFNDSAEYSISFISMTPYYGEQASQYMLYERGDTLHGAYSNVTADGIAGSASVSFWREK